LRALRWIDVSLAPREAEIVEGCADHCVVAGGRQRDRVPELVAGHPLRLVALAGAEGRLLGKGSDVHVPVARVSLVARAEVQLAYPVHAARSGLSIGIRSTEEHLRRARREQTRKRRASCRRRVAIRKTHLDGPAGSTYESHGVPLPRG